MFFLSKKKNPHDMFCLVCHVIVTILLFLAAVASIVGALTAHYDLRAETLIFGTNAGSLSLIAFGLTATLFMKSLKACMSECEVCGTNGKK